MESLRRTIDWLNRRSIKILGRRSSCRMFACGSVALWLIDVDRVRERHPERDLTCRNLSRPREGVIPS